MVPFESVSICMGRNYEIFSAIFYLVQDLNLDQLHLKEKKSRYCSSKTQWVSFGSGFNRF